jgi:hypothetical protein
MRAGLQAANRLKGLEYNTEYDDNVTLGTSVYP